MFTGAWWFCTGGGGAPFLEEGRFSRRLELLLGVWGTVKRMGLG
jgi:hypothetical protein